MNKIIIPTLLIATVIAVGFFAFIPIEQASTAHSTITDKSMIPFKIACTEISLTGNSDNGEITLDVNGNNPIIVTAIYLESGTGTGAVTDANDTIVITDIRVDTVTLGTYVAVSLADITFDAIPTEGEIMANIDQTSTQNIGDLIANTDIGVTVDGTVNTDTTKYIVTFAGLQIANDAAPTCDITGVT